MFRNYLYIVILLFIGSCSSEEFKTDPSGMKYLFYVENEQNKKPVAGDIIVLFMSYMTEDTVLFDSKDLMGQPIRMRVNNPPASGGTVDNAFMMMHEGDSACFIVSAEKFYLETKGTEVPPYIKKGSKLTFYIKLVEIFNMDKYNSEKKENAVSSEEAEKSMLDQYLKNANIKIEPTNSGLYYIEENAGSGQFPKSGQKITIHYTGSYVSGEVFDSSLERGEPFTFVFGANQVINGMEEGISLMKKGGTATLIIPSYLAYGKEGYKSIPPYSTLIFEIEILNIN